VRGQGIPLPGNSVQSTAGSVFDRTESQGKVAIRHNRVHSFVELPRRRVLAKPVSRSGAGFLHCVSRTAYFICTPRHGVPIHQSGRSHSAYS